MCFYQFDIVYIVNEKTLITHGFTMFCNANLLEKPYSIINLQPILRYHNIEYTFCCQAYIKSKNEFVAVCNVCDSLDLSVYVSYQLYSSKESFGFGRSSTGNKCSTKVRCDKVGPKTDHGCIMD